MSPSPWNSLEVAKLLVSIATPLTVVIVGFLVQRTLAKQDRVWRAQQHLAERRFAIYNDIRKELNRIFCFVEDRGTWKEETPDSVIGYKRFVDQTMYTNRAIWAPDTFRAYVDYTNAAFAVYQGVGVDAKIITSPTEKRIGINGWQDEWDDRLTGKVNPEHETRYNVLLDRISRDLTLEARQ